MDSSYGCNASMIQHLTTSVDVIEENARIKSNVDEGVESGSDLPQRINFEWKGFCYGRVMNELWFTGFESFGDIELDAVKRRDTNLKRTKYVRVKREPDLYRFRIKRKRENKATGSSILNIIEK
eukprot:TRINITY_DN201_c1_g1_i1.p1 TRINITY_DN201_c1_g1~~TRINITY_DN201_c1_g1_i1.p1  ORF type:complete len:124 (+),score=8.91 TRINITY_DN201_c1_g1_i1:15-386(+)